MFAFIIGCIVIAIITIVGITIDFNNSDMPDYEPENDKEEMSQEVTDKLEVLTDLTREMSGKVASVEELTLTWEYMDTDSISTDSIVPIVKIRGLVMK